MRLPRVKGVYKRGHTVVGLYTGKYLAVIIDGSHGHGVTSGSLHVRNVRGSLTAFAAPMQEVVDCIKELTCD